MKRMKYTINGKFLLKKITGVQRYAYEICRTLDKLCIKDELEILVPKYCDNVPDYKNIRVVLYGNIRPNLWEQMCVPVYLIKQNRIGINLCNIAPLIKPDIVCSHDMNFRVNPEYFTKINVIWANIQHFNFKYRAKYIITVSEFSKKEIIREYEIPEKKIMVVPNAWQHMKRIVPDYRIFEKYPEIERGNYFFMLASLAPHKNFRWIIENAKRNPKSIYVIAGNMNKMLYGTTENICEIENILYIGYISDEEAKALMECCKAFIFPSFYEGFGIPPLEALSVKAKVICADTSSLPEVCEDAVVYINPGYYEYDLNKLAKKETGDAGKVLDKYSWEKSAEYLYRNLKKFDCYLKKGN